MKKLIKITLMIIGILLLVLLILNLFIFNQSDISSKIGFNKLEETSIAEYYTVKQACLEKYFNYINSGEFDRAYKLLSNEYKEIKDFNTFKTETEAKGTLSFEIGKIYKKSKGVFVAELILNNINSKYIVYIDEMSKTFAISPDSFIKNYDKKYSINNWDFSLKINSYTVETDMIEFKATIKNKSSKNSLDITDFIVYSNNGSSFTGENKIKLEPKEERNIEFVVKNNMEFPESAILIRNISEKNQTKKYSFEF
jgi:hypothetical protein